MSDLMNSESFNSFFKTDNVFVLDRGSRYVEEKLKDAGYKVYMLSLLAKNQKQFMTEQANYFRIVTKVRYAVEDVNGRVKSLYKLFNNVWQNRGLDHAFTDFKIGCALLNRFGTRLETDQEVDFDIDAKMRRRNISENPMSSIARFKRYVTESKQWTNLDAEYLLQKFPTLTYSQLMHFTPESYQKHQALDYYAEHKSPNRDFLIQVNKDIITIALSGTSICARDPVLIRARIQSRHSSATKYLAYVFYEKSEPLNIFYICQCKSGTRKIVCCAHIATLIWYLGYARHQGSTRVIQPPTSTRPIRYESEDEEEPESRPLTLNNAKLQVENKKRRYF